MESLLRQLLERAEAEGREGWIRRCLSLPPSAKFAECSTRYPLMEEPSAEEGELLTAEFTEAVGGREELSVVPGQQSGADGG